MEVAQKAIVLARASAAAKGSLDRAAHVGFYLIDRGLPELERAAAVKSSMGGAWRQIARRFPLPFYLGAVAAITGIATGALAVNAVAPGIDWALLAPVVVLCLLVTSQLAVTIVNWMATLIVTPRPLPRMDFSTGIAAEARTLVIVPTMLTSAQNVEDLVAALEVRFLANRDAHLHFGLLTDFPDAREESLPADEPLLELAEARINELNRKYGRGEHSPATETGNTNDGGANLYVGTSNIRTTTSITTIAAMKTKSGGKMARMIRTIMPLPVPAPGAARRSRGRSVARRAGCCGARPVDRSGDR